MNNDEWFLIAVVAIAVIAGYSIVSFIVREAPSIAMTQEQFDDLVNRLENEARCKPFAYRCKVFLLSSLGNAYVGFIISILLGLLAALVVLIIRDPNWIAREGIVIVGGFLYLVLRALWVRIEPPAGIEISASQAPKLFATINELRSALGAPGFDHVH